MIFGDGTFFDAMRRGLKTLRETGKQIADPIIELRQMANRIAQPEMGPLAISMPLAQGMRKGGVVKGKKAKAPKATAMKKAPKKTKK